MFTPTGGVIAISASIVNVQNQKFLNMVVQDSGRGILKYLLEKIFENYYQVERKDESEGSGIGLALTKVLVNMHKGSTRAESDFVRGTRFIVELNVSESAFCKDEKSNEVFDYELLVIDK